MSPIIIANDNYGVSKFCSEYKINRKKTLQAKNRSSILSIKRSRSGRKMLRKVTYHTGCTGTVNWVQESFLKLCTISGDEKLLSYEDQVDILANIKVPSFYFMLFDGFGDFDSKKAIKLGATNITGLEGNDNLVIDKGTSRGLDLYKTWISPKEENQKLSQDSKDLHNFFYFAGSGNIRSHNTKNAVACTQHLENYHQYLSHVYPDLNHPEIIGMGFSNGGSAVLDYQNQLGKKDISTKLIMTFDPIPRAGLFLFSKIGNLLSKRHSLTQKLINFYQTTDHGSVPGLTLRGEDVVDADLNMVIDPTLEYEMNDDGSNNHVDLTDSDIAIYSFKCEMNKLILKVDKNCDYNQYYQIIRPQILLEKKKQKAIQDQEFRDEQNEIYEEIGELRMQSFAEYMKMSEEMAITKY